MLNDAEFSERSAEALEDLFDRLARAGDRYGFEADMNGGALTIEFEDPPKKFVVSPNSPVKQIWVSAHLRSSKLDWSDEAGTFVLAGQTLVALIADAIAKQLGESVEL